MADVHCPMCGKPNPADAEVCQFCAARLKPLSIKNDTPQPEDDLPDWLRDLRDADQPQSGAGPAGEESQPISQPPAGQESDTPDWLARIRELNRQTEDQAGSSDLPAWMPEEKPLPESGAAADSVDWLNELRASSAGESNPPAESPSLPGNPPAGAQGEEELPPWLADLGISSDQTSPAAAPQQPSPVESEAPAPETPTPAAEEGALPGWLADLGTPAPAEPAVPQPEALAVPPEVPAPAVEEGALPGWLAELGAAAPAEPAAPQPEALAVPPEVPAPAAEEGALPESTLVAPSAAPQETPFEGQELDWLFAQAEIPPAEAGMEQPTALPSDQAPTGVAPQEPPTITPAGQAAAAEPGVLPDWLASLKPGEMPAPEGQPAVSAEESMPEWLANLQGQQPGAQEPAPAFSEDQGAAAAPGAPEQVNPFVSEDLPDWLARIKAPGEEPPPVIPVEKKEEEAAGLELAELPGWVQAMRPIESATPHELIPAETDERQEKVGPLAGLRGILPAEAFPAAIRKPPIYSARLQITEKQRTNAALFDSLLATEAEPQPVEKESPRLAKNFLNVVVSIILIVLIWLPLWKKGVLNMPLPGFTLPETEEVQKAINDLPQGATVLVACDYEPAMVGEMEAVSTGVMADLAKKSVKLVLISTNPTGAVLCDQLVAKAAKSQPETINLGYLAGGSSALRDFTIDPKITAPVTASGQNAWEQPILKNLDQGGNPLLNLKQIIVITTDVDTARTWIEQVKTNLADIPLDILSSAQAAPMIRPYFESKQVKGMVSGITGGSVYEQNTQGASANRDYWDSYQVGLLFVIALIILGSLVNIVDGLFKQRKLQKGK